MTPKELELIGGIIEAIEMVNEEVIYIKFIVYLITIYLLVSTIYFIYKIQKK